MKPRGIVFLETILLGVVESEHFLEQLEGVTSIENTLGRCSNNDSQKMQHDISEY